MGFLVVFWFLFFVLLLFWVLLVLVFGCFVRVFIGVYGCFYGPFSFWFFVSLWGEVGFIVFYYKGYMDVFVFIFGGLMDEKSEAQELSGVGLLLMAAESLKRSIEFTIRQLKAKKVKGEMKLRWSRALVRQVEALVKVVEALNRVGGKSGVELDLASYLAGLESQIPKRFVSREFTGIVRRVQARVSRRRR